jgi:transcriptional regulator with XRE-family HTH domain
MLEETEQSIAAGNLLKQYRLRAGFTQNRLAEHLAVDPTTISRWEQGTRRPGIGLMNLLVEGLMLSDIERNQLLEHLGYGPPLRNNKESPQTDEPGLSNADSSDKERELQRLEELVGALWDRIRAQEEEIAAKNKQIEQLHVLLQQAQTALPAPKDSRPWWQKLWHRDGR